ncbi:hypothetical protein D5086_025166 [Populus alba]|uniref:Uncharacterized protein n=1 Tax=Populus alba TaxID=43335 RepID=A0ACC4B7J8_POPAL
MELSRNLLIKSTLARLLSFIVLFFAVRFAYFIAVKGRSCVSNDFCFFPPQNLDFTIHYHSATTSRCTVDHYLSVFQDLIADGFLSPISKSLCIETLTGEAIIALKEIGVIDSTGISKKSKKIKKSSPPLILPNYPLSFHDNTFDFQFTNNLDWSGQPDEFGLIKSREINGVDSMSMMMIREVVLMKVGDFLWRGNVGSNCSVSRLKRELAKNAEALIAKEPLKPWITLKRNLKNVKYLSDSVDIGFKRKYVYVDVGARSFGSKWLKNVVVERDFVVVKLDVEGTEFHLIPRLVETGAICLIDELFLECHYNRWQRCCPGQRDVKYQKTYDQCLQLLTSLRKIGVLVHQWW